MKLLHLVVGCDRRVSSALCLRCRYSGAGLLSYWPQHSSTSKVSSALDNRHSQLVAKGKYTEGQRAGEACVCKWFKSGSVYEVRFFEEDIKAMEKARDIIVKWNLSAILDSKIKLNIPEVWTFDKDSSDWAGRKTLQEPYIKNYEKFNSNTGWMTDDLPWGRVMQALSHFSYHVTSGQLLLCDLQGGIYRDDAVLTDPVILSRTRAYGVTDLGPEGISTFFSTHECNEFCRKEWQQPRNQGQFYRPQQGTSMAVANNVPSRSSRPLMSGVCEEYADCTYGNQDSDDDYY
eukprot:gene21582-28579_t